MAPARLTTKILTPRISTLTGKGLPGMAFIIMKPVAWQDALMMKLSINKPAGMRFYRGQREIGYILVFECPDDFDLIHQFPQTCSKDNPDFRIDDTCSTQKCSSLPDLVIHEWKYYLIQM
jgi:hypothetical protein